MPKARRNAHIIFMTMMLLPYSAILTLEGPDTVSLLERLITCRVDDMLTGDIRPGALLTPQGKVIADFLLTRTEAGCTLYLHQTAAATLEKRLKLFRLRSDVDITLSEHNAPVANHLERIRAGLPAFGDDFQDTEVFPTDINLDLRGGVDYKKGCFVGQEVVSRMKRRGKIRKRTIRLIGTNISDGADVRAGEIRLGKITSTAGREALALIRIDHLSKALAANTALHVNEDTVKPDLQEWLKQEMKDLQEATSNV